MNLKSLYPMDIAKRYPMDLKSRKQSILVSGSYHTVGLKPDGTCVAVGDNRYGQCDVSRWSNIVAISCGYHHTVGLKSDGTVVAVGDSSDGQCRVSGWRNIVAIAAGYYHTVGLKADGTCVAAGRSSNGVNVSNLRNIVDIKARYHTLALKADGTCIACDGNNNNNNNYGQCNVSNWSNIIAIATGHNLSVGLKADGTCVATGQNSDGQCNVSDWSDIVSITSEFYFTAGLKADGTCVAVGLNDSGQCNVSGWSNIVAIAVGANHTVGLKPDGTVVAVGDNRYGQCNVSDWKLATYNSCKLGFLKDSTNELYSVVDGFLTKVSDDWTAEENKESIVNDTLCDEIPTMGELNALGQFKIVSFSKEGSQPVTTIKVKQKPQILKPKTLVNMAFDTFAGFKFTSSNSNVLFKVLLTTDLNDYKYYDTETSSWVVSDDFEGKGMTLDELNNLSVEAFQSLVTDSIKKLAFGFYVEFLDAISASTDIEFAVTGVRNGMWQKAVNGTDYQYGYPFNDLLRVIFLTAGDYKINYQE